eukprot:1157371-Pelagomonas_calceolata.AAC.2
MTSRKRCQHHEYWSVYKNDHLHQYQTYTFCPPSLKSGCARFRKAEPYTANGQGQDIFALKRQVFQACFIKKNLQMMPKKSFAPYPPMEGLGGRTDVSASAACLLCALLLLSTPAAMPATPVRELQEPHRCISVSTGMNSLLQMSTCMFAVNYEDNIHLQAVRSWHRRTVSNIGAGDGFLLTIPNLTIRHSQHLQASLQEHETTHENASKRNMLAALGTQLSAPSDQEADGYFAIPLPTVEAGSWCINHPTAAAWCKNNGVILRAHPPPILKSMQAAISHMLAAHARCRFH